jgi:DNA-binding response OmpR family regulator
VSERPAELILIVDDDPKIARLIEAYLTRAGYRTEVAADGRAALRLIRELSPALVVLDLMLPELDGREVARIAREESDVSIIMVTALGGTPERVSGLEGGADDYIPKPFAPSELVARVKSVLRRVRPYPSDQVLRHRDLVVDPARRAVRTGGRELELTAAEFDILYALVRGRGRVLTRDALMDAVLRTEAEVGIQERSIDVYVRRLRSKLGDDARHPRYVRTVRGVGYRLAGT